MPNYPMIELETSTLFERTYYADPNEAEPPEYHHCPECGAGFIDKGSARSHCADERRERQHKEQELKRREATKQRRVAQRNTKIGDENVSEIYALVKSGKRRILVAHDYGVSRQFVDQVMNGTIYCQEYKEDWKNDPW